MLVSALVFIAGSWFLLDAWVAANYGVCISPGGGPEPILTCFGGSPVASGIAILSVILVLLGVVSLAGMAPRIYPALGWVVIPLSFTAYILLLYVTVLAPLAPPLQADLLSAVLFLPPVILGTVGGFLGQRWMRFSPTISRFAGLSHDP